MLFNSYSFIFLYLPITFAGMFWLARFSHRLTALWLGLASLVFYAVWDSRLVLLLIASIAFNYGAGYWIGLCRNAGRHERGRISLIAAIATNLGLLGYFKYINFFIASANQAAGTQMPLLDIVLPLGISFFTFTQIAFLVDVYRGIAREYNFIHYLLFVTYFPHLIAGPVLHHGQMMPQFANPATYRISCDNVAAGLTVFVLGLSKKVLIADNLALYASPVFKAASDGQVLTLFEAWGGALAYTLQLYFDFSGYSDMAIGLSLMFNVRLPLNFDSPYKATNIIEFWRRWHMTLSAFLRDYLYIPLGGNRKGKVRRHVNLMATMLLGGLWHGAGWTFIVWGALHGFYLIVNHGWRGVKRRLGWSEGGAVARLAAGALTFCAVVVAWVFFRADSLTSAQAMLAGMAGANGLSLHNSWAGRLATVVGSDPLLAVRFDGMFPATLLDAGKVFRAIAFGLAVVWLLPNVREIFQHHGVAWDDSASQMPKEDTRANSGRRWLSWRPSIPIAFISGLVLFAVLLAIGANKSSEFLYFQF